MTHSVSTLEHGSFVAKETVRVCATRCTHPNGKLVTRRSGELARQVAPGAIYGYDVEVYVGLQRYLHHRQRQEIQGELADHYNVNVSAGQVSILGARFLEHLEALHRKRIPLLKRALAQDGGYPLHIDATGEDGRGTLFVAYAGWRQWVLGSWKLSTERSDQMLPRLREVVGVFGTPIAIMRDFGRAPILASRELVRELGKPVPILGCHLHFLADVGEDLLKDSYARLREHFRRARVLPGLRELARKLGRGLGAELPSLREDVAQWASSATEHALPAGLPGLAIIRALAQWILDHARDGDQYGFPFDRPYLYLYERARSVRRAVDAFLRRPPEDERVRRILGRLARILDPVIADDAFVTTATILVGRAALFDELRQALRLKPKLPSKPPVEHARLSAEQTAAQLQDIRQALKNLDSSLRQRRPQRGSAEDTRNAIDTILTHLDRHGDSLWGHIIHLPEQAGGGIRLVERTNNLMESFFHRMKHAERRRSGRKILTQDFESLPATAALAYNLAQNDYINILCGTLADLPAAFADLDAFECAQSLATSPTTSRPLPAAQLEMTSASLPHLDKPVLRAAPLRAAIEAAARSRAPRFQPVVR